MYGLKYTMAEKHRLAGLAQRGRKRKLSRKPVFTEERLAGIRFARSGPRSNFWKGGVTSDRANIGRWTRENAPRVHERHNFKCAICSSKRGLHAHHVDPVWHNPSLARVLDNLITLCTPCHKRVHADNLELELLNVIQTGRPLESFFEGKARQPRPREKKPRRTTKLIRTYSWIVSIEYVGEQMTYDLEVEGPFHNFVANGLVVHNSVNEYSGRYSLMPMLFHLPSREQIQTQSRSNNQGRSGSTVPDSVYQEALRRWEKIREESRATYEWLTGEDVARELARIDLPLSTYTQWYWKIDLHNLLHFLTLRVDRHAQWEIQEYGRVMAGMLKRAAPLSYEAWIDFDVCGARLSRAELTALRRLVAHKGDGLEANGATLSMGDLESMGLSKREARELFEKLDDTTVPDFELDLSKAQSAESFAARFAQAVPKVDKAPVE